MGSRIGPMNLRRGLSGVFYVAGPTQPESAPAITVAHPPATATGNGRRMTFEEAMAQQMLQMNQTAAGTNHLLPDAEPIPLPDLGEKYAGSEFHRSKTPYVYMGVQGQAAGQIVLPAIGAQATVVQFRCPRRSNGEIEFIANQYSGGGWVEGSGGMIWQLLIDSIPVQGFDSILGSMGTLASPGWLGKGAIQFSEDQLIQLIVKNISVPANQQPIEGMLRGHFYPIEEEGPDTWV